MITSPPDISSLMSALPEGTIPPQYAPLVQLLGSMLKDENDDEPEDPEPSRELAQLRQRVRAQAQRLAQAQRVIRAYRQQNRLLARAHGACECWGGNSACAHCGGHGAARWVTPDRDLLRDLLGDASASPESPDRSDVPFTQSTTENNT